MRVVAAVGPGAIVFVVALCASAQPRAAPAGPALPEALPVATSLRARFGADAAARLMRSTDPEDRLRGIERAAATDSNAALALLERAGRASGPGALDPRLPDEGIARRDPRALLAVVRGLARWTDNDGARAVLDEIVRAPAEAFATHPPGVAAGPTSGASSLPAPGTASRDPAADEAEGAERVTRARQEAAIALATSGSPVAFEHLVTAARSGGPGQDAALHALALVPPSDPLTLGGVALTTAPIIAVAAQIGDLRALDSILGAIHTSDPALRAAALEALSGAGDTRAVEAARGALHDDDLRVRVAATEALARLATPDAAAAVEALVMDDATALEGLRIARSVQGEGVVKAAAARAVGGPGAAMREAAIVALGRQTSPAAVQALVALATMTTPATTAAEGDAACALARSPSADALGALEGMAGHPSLRRLAARAYLVRRFLHGDRSARLDATLDALAASNDPLDRAVGTQALVTLGERTLALALADPDARVRRAGAMGALARPASSDATDAASATMTARAAGEADEATRDVLSIRWLSARGDANTPSSLLIERAEGSGPDAPLAAFALARRSDEPPSAEVEALLRSPDPLLRAYAARGLGASPSSSAAGRLGEAYAWEGDATVRRAILAALAERHDDRDAEAARRVFEVAARLDPDVVARWIASSARAGAVDAERAYTTGRRDIAWIHLEPGDTAAPLLGETGLLATSDGRVIPIAFDDEGYALVAGVSPGEARLRLAPRLPSYSPSRP